MVCVRPRAALGQECLMAGRGCGKAQGPVQTTFPCEWSGWVLERDFMVLKNVMFSGCGLLKLPKTAGTCVVHGLLAAGVLERASHP